MFKLKPISSVKNVSFEKRRAKTGVFFTIPWIIGALALLVYPLFYSIRLAFSTVTDVVSKTYAFAGFANFKIAFENEDFLKMLKNTSIDAIVNTPLIIVFSLLIALALNQKFGMRAMFRTLFFLPVSSRKRLYHAAAFGNECQRKRNAGCKGNTVAGGAYKNPAVGVNCRNKRFFHKNNNYSLEIGGTDYNFSGRASGNTGNPL